MPDQTVSPETQAEASAGQELIADFTLVLSREQFAFLLDLVEAIPVHTVRRHLVRDVHKMVKEMQAMWAERQEKWDKELSKKEGERQ